MSDRHFHLKLSATYRGDENNIDDLTVEVLHDDNWEALDLDIRSPGFLLFINALFSCQHLYMRTNCAERKLILLSSKAEMKVETDEVWAIKNVAISFVSQLKSGVPVDDDLEYITERMGHCPVTTNLSHKIKITSSVVFE